MSSELNRGMLEDRRTAAQAELAGVDRAHTARRFPIIERLRLYDALLADNGPGEDEQYRQSLLDLLQGKWHVPNVTNEVPIHREAQRLLEELEGRMKQR